MTTVIQDCKTLSPLDVGNPWYHQCFGWRPLPAQFNVTVGPFVDAGGNTCYMTDKSQRTGLLVRQSPCNFIWAPNFSYNGPGISLYVDENTTPLSHHVNQNAAELFTWRVQNEVMRTSASCTQTGPPESGTVRVDFYGVISDDYCQAPYHIWYEG